MFGGTAKWNSHRTLLSIQLAQGISPIMAQPITTTPKDAVTCYDNFTPRHAINPTTTENNASQLYHLPHKNAKKYGTSYIDSVWSVRGKL